MRSITAADVAAMVSSIHEGGGELRLSGLSGPERAGWRRIIHAAITQGGLPAGTRLRHTGRDRGDLVIRLVADTADNEPRKPETAKVPVPTRLPGRPHPIVTATREAATPTSGWVNTRRKAGVAHISVARSSVPRALRLLQGLFAEAERRGYQTGTTGGDRTCAGGAAVVIGGHRFEVVLAEERRRVPHQLTAAEQSRPADYRWAPRWDYVPSGRLVLRLGHGSYGPPLATDRTRWQIEDRLGHAFERLEAAAADAVKRDQQRAREEQERQARHEAELERQRREQIAAGRVSHLTGQVAAWRLAADIHAFVDQARSSVDPRDSTAAAWLDGAVFYAESIDPLRNPIGFPDEPAPGATIGGAWGTGTRWRATR